MNKREKVLKNLRRVAIIFFIMFLVYWALLDTPVLRYYTIESDKIDNHVRIVQLSDLHSCYYGDNESELIDAIDSVDPDVIVLTGDIFDDEILNTNSEIVISALAKKYPIFYISGNHDLWASSDMRRDQRRILKENNVTVLKESSQTIIVNDEYIRFYGIQDPAFSVKKKEDNYRHDSGYVRGQLWMLEYKPDNNVYSILLAHRPEFAEIYDKWNFDLVLSGHTHGGVVRIPLLLNGLYAWGQGFFPAYSGGLYTLDNCLMIISRGLSRESSGKRVFNRPEIVVIDLW